MNGSSLFYYRLEDGKEIDFLLRDGHVTSDLTQVCLNLSSIETKEREVRSLMQAEKNFPDAKLSIVTADESGKIQTGLGNWITLIPSYEFCLQLPCGLIHGE